MKSGKQLWSFRGICYLHNHFRFWQKLALWNNSTHPPDDKASLPRRRQSLQLLILEPRVFLVFSMFELTYTEFNAQSLKMKSASIGHKSMKCWWKFDRLFWNFSGTRNWVLYFWLILRHQPYKLNSVNDDRWQYPVQESTAYLIVIHANELYHIKKFGVFIWYHI
jgi:hypothetical protein